MGLWHDLFPLVKPLVGQFLAQQFIRPRADPTLSLPPAQGETPPVNQCPYCESFRALTLCKGYLEVAEWHPDIQAEMLGLAREYLRPAFEAMRRAGEEALLTQLHVISIDLAVPTGLGGADLDKLKDDVERLRHVMADLAKAANAPMAATTNGERYDPNRVKTLETEVAALREEMAQRQGN